jgi:GNAT superfamily N-acetyltransferase
MCPDTTVLRPLEAGDLEAVIALDRAHSGQSRRGFFEKRWQAMASEPSAFVGIAADRDGKVTGFILAHILDGEFGGTAPAALMDAIGVTVEARGQGTGSALMRGLIDEVRARGARELRTQARWDQRGLLDFFARSGFNLAPRVVLERSTAELGW